MNNIEFLKGLTNPIDDDKKLEEILDCYSKNADLDEEIIEKDIDKRNIETVNVKDIDDFEVTLFKIWKKKVKNYTLSKALMEKDKTNELDNAKKIIEEANPKNAKQVRSFFEKYSQNKGFLGKISRKKPTSEIISLLSYKKDSSSDINKISSDNIYLNNDMGKIEHRLYVNLDSNVQYPFATKFIQECERKGIPFSINFDKNDCYYDSFTILSDDKHLNEYINIINEIINKDNTIKAGVNATPVLTSKVNDSIGYNEETKDSYLETRSKLIKESLDTISEKIKFDGLKTGKIKVGDKEISYRDFLSQIIYDNRMSELRDESNSKKGKIRKVLSLKSRAIESKSFKNKLKKMINKRLDEAIKVQLDPEKMKKRKLNFEINSAFVITSDDIQKAIRTQSKVLYKKNPVLKSQIKNLIKSNASKYGISGFNICLSDSTEKKLFDGVKKTETKKDESKSKTKSTTKEGKKTTKQSSALDDLLDGDKSKKQSSKQSDKSENKSETKFTYKPMTDEEIRKAKENIEYDKYEKIYAERNKAIKEQRAQQEKARKTQEQRSEQERARKAQEQRAEQERARKVQEQRAEQERARKAQEQRAEQERARKTQEQRVEQERARKVQEQRAEQERARKTQEQTTQQEKYKTKGTQTSIKTPEDLVDFLRESNTTIINNGTINVTINNYGNEKERKQENNIQYNKDSVKVLKR